MTKWIAPLALVFISWNSHAKDEVLTTYLSSLRSLRFDEARQIATSVKDSALSADMLLMCDLLYYGGQQDPSKFTLPNNTSEVDNINHAVIRLLNEGYFNLFYDHVKGDAYRSFYKAHQLAEASGDREVLKASVYAFLKYYGFEMTQDNPHKEHLAELEQLRSDETDDVWITLYKMILLTKSLDGLDSSYFLLAKNLDTYENKFEQTDPLLPYILYEKALKLYLNEDISGAAAYYQKTADLSEGHPFLNTERFLSLVKLMNIATNNKDFSKARQFQKQAAAAINRADTVRSNFYLYLYGSLLMAAENKPDSAYNYLLEVYKTDFLLDLRRNTFEINRLNVELETQEKENANLRLREGRIWLITALLATGLITVATYYAYVGQRARNKIQARDAQVAQEKLLKEQELIGVNSMLEGQEKERQRLANELHDNLGSVLATLKFHFNSIRDRSTKAEPQSSQLLDQTDKLLDEAYQSVRSIAHMRNAGVDPNEGLLPAVKLLASKVSNMNSLSIEVNDHAMDRRLNNTLELTAFRIVQELIANIVKHAKATTATIHLTQHEETLNIMIEDNGLGFDSTQIKSSAGMGLYSIQKRVEGLGGSVTIESSAKSGTTVIIDLPTI